MPYRTAPPASPGYGWIIPILLALASLVLFVTCLPLVGRNANCREMAPAVHGRVLDYVEDESRAEGQVLRVQLYSGDSPFALVSTRDDRPWRTFARDESVRVLHRSGLDRRGHPTLEYIIDDFAAMWGGLLARASAAVFCDIAAVVALLLGRRRPSAATRFPPPLPRTPAP